VIGATPTPPADVMDLDDHHTQSDDEDDEEEMEVILEQPPVEAASSVRKVALGSNNHATVSQARHTPHSSILEILENAFGRLARGVHMSLETFETGTPFFVSTSSTEISVDDFKVCLDQRPRKKDDKTHQLSVFGDGMKSSANCLTNGAGNLYVLVQQRDAFWIARYGKPLDDLLQPDKHESDRDCMLIESRWDPRKGCALADDGAPLPAEEAARRHAQLAGASALAPPNCAPANLGARVNALFEHLQKVVTKHSYEHAFMQVAGPLAERPLADGAAVPVVAAAGEGALSVWQQDRTQLDLARLIASQYMPPDCPLAKAKNPTTGKPNPSTSTKVFVCGKRVDLTAGPWSEIDATPTDKMPVLVRGKKVAEMQVKELKKDGFHQSDPERPLEMAARCGALVATEGGRFLSLDPHAFLQDRLCVHSLSAFPVMDLYELLYSSSAAQNFQAMHGKLVPLMVEPFKYSRDDFVHFNDLHRKLRKEKTSMYRAVGAASVALVQLQICLPTDTSKTKLDLNQLSGVHQPSDGAAIGAAEVLGAIFRTLVTHTFEKELKALQAEEDKRSAEAAKAEAEKAKKAKEKAEEARKAVEQARERAAAAAKAAQAEKEQRGRATAAAKAQEEAAAHAAKAAEAKKRKAEREAQKQAEAAKEASEAAKRGKAAGAAAAAGGTKRKGGAEAGGSPAAKKAKKGAAQLSKQKVEKGLEPLRKTVDRYADKIDEKWPAEAKKFHELVVKQLAALPEKLYK